MRDCVFELVDCGQIAGGDFVSHVFGLLTNAWWGGIAIVAILQLHGALVHIGNAMMARATVENAKLTARR